MKKKPSLLLFFIFSGIHQIASNFAHPVTPSIINGLGLPSYMFGLAFSCMATTNFLFSPFWGQRSDAKGRVKTMAICACGYACGQLIFSMANSGAMILCARLLAGAFAGGYTISSMAYVADMSTIENRGQNMSYLAAITVMGGSFGYFVGGMIGDYSIKMAFVAQVSVILVNAFLYYHFLGEAESWQPVSAEGRSLNPFSAFKEAGEVLTKPLLTFLLAVFAANFATMAFDNMFNYYLKDAYNFPPSYNGKIKAAVGIIGLVVNFTINIWIARKTDSRKSIITVLTCCGVSLGVALMMPNVSLFIAVVMVFYTFNSMYQPILQALAVEDNDASNGVVAGLFNSTKSMGMIFGPLFAGFVYEINKMYPFIGASIAFFISAVICFVNLGQYKKVRQEREMAR